MNCEWYVENFIAALKHAKDIYVREEINGKWQTIVLTKVPTEKAIGHIVHWLNTTVIPARITK